MRKGILEFCVLSILAREEAYTYGIFQRLKEAKVLVVEGTLYPILSRLRKSGYVDYRWEESQYGPPRKYYCLTKEGSAFLNDLASSWDKLTEAVSHIRGVLTTNEKKGDKEGRKEKDAADDNI